MAGDRTIAPTAARVARAWREGLRPAHRWLTAAVAVWAVTWVIPRVAPGPEDLDSLSEELAAPGVADVAAVEPLLWSAAVVAAAVVFTIVGAWVVVSLATGTVGARTRPTIEPGPSPGVFDVLWAIVTLSAASALVVVSLGVIAGAARAPTSAWSGLRELWMTWGGRVGAVAGALLLCAGLAELAAERWRIVRRLYASKEQLHQEQTRRGGGPR